MHIYTALFYIYNALFYVQGQKELNVGKAVPIQEKKIFKKMFAEFVISVYFSHADDIVSFHTVLTRNSFACKHKINKL